MQAGAWELIISAIVEWNVDGIMKLGDWQRDAKMMDGR